MLRMALPSSVTQSRTDRAWALIPSWRTLSFLFPNQLIMFFASSLKFDFPLYAAPRPLEDDYRLFVEHQMDPVSDGGHLVVR